MISSPRKGERVQLWYAAKWRGAARHHGRIGTVEIVGKGRPRNHGVRVGDELVVVNAGHLRKPLASADDA